jgi:hypothetical protein
MGYRSDVMALVYPNRNLAEAEIDADYDRLKTIMNTTYKEVFEEWGTDFTWNDERRVLRFTCTDVKWYPSYVEIEAFNNFIEDVGNELGYVTEFVRVGEETDDIEQSFGDHAEYYLTVHRTIECEV